jgi:hypothetical protein
MAVIFCEASNLTKQASRVSGVLYYTASIAD